MLGTDFTGLDIFKDIDLTSPIEQMSKEIGQQVAGIKDQTLSVVNTGASKLKEGVALINEADTQFFNAINNFKSETLGKLNSLLSTLTGGMLNINDFTDLISLVDGFKLDASALLNKLSGLVGFDIGNIPGFANNFLNKLMSQLNQVSGGYLGSIRGKDGVILQMTRTFNNGVTQTLTETLAKLGLGNYSDYYSVAVKNSLYNTLMDETIKAGMVDAYVPLYQKYDDRNDADLAIIGGLGNALSNGDVVSVRKLTATVQDMSIQVIAATYPNGAETLLENFKIQPGATARDYPEIAKNLLEACIAIGGENWWKVYTTNWGWVPNLLMGSKLTPDVIKVMMDNQDLFPLMAVRNRYDEHDAIDQFIIDFPTVPFKR